MRNLEVSYQAIESDIAAYASLLYREEYHRLGMGDLYGIAALLERRPIGILLYEKREDMLWLHRVFVAGGYRRQGIGSGLLEWLCSYADAEGMELFCAFDGEASIRDPFYRFLAATHAFYLERTEGLEVYLSQADAAALCSKYAKNATKAEKATPFFDASRQMQVECITHLRELYPQIAWELEWEQAEYCRALCYCVIERGEICALSLVKKRRDGALELQLLYARAGKGILAAQALLGSIAALAKAGVKPVYLSAVNLVSMRILDEMCPRYCITKRFYRAYYIGKSV